MSRRCMSSRRITVALVIIVLMGAWIANVQHIDPTSEEGAAPISERNNHLEPMKIHSFRQSVHDVDITSDGTFFLTVTSSNLYWYSVGEDLPIWTGIVGGSEAVISDDDTTILFRNYNIVGLYSTTSPLGPTNAPFTYYETRDRVTSMDISSTGDIIVVGDVSGYVYLLSRHRTTGLLSLVWETPLPSSITSVSVSNDGRFVAAGSDWRDPWVYFFSTSLSTPLWKYSAPSHVAIVDVGSNGDFLLTNIRSDIALFGRDSNTPIWVYQTRGNIESCAVSLDYRLFITGGGDRTLHVVSYEGKPVIREFIGYWIQDIDYSSTNNIPVFTASGLEIHGDEHVWVVGNYILIDGEMYTFFVRDTSIRDGRVAISENGNHHIFSYHNKTYLFELPTR